MPSVAATVDVIGADGDDGGPGATLPNFGGEGEAGEAGGAADAISDSSDLENTASASGGAGGLGGTGGNGTPDPPQYFSFGGMGGAGGAGGAANARAEVTAGDEQSEIVASEAIAIGGDGGGGGAGGTGFDAAGPGGAGGAGGAAEANADSTSLTWAEARAEATGGRGGVGGVQPTPYNPMVPPTLGVGGRGGDAVANARASGGDEVVFASARATGGDTGEGTISGADTTPLDGGSASAFAESNAEGHAIAHADATGGRAARSSLPYGGVYGDGGDAQARARAVSQRDASASAIQTAGPGAPGWEGQFVSGPYLVGGPGGNSVMVDAVEGSAGGLLQLSQSANGGQGGGGARGGDASSELTASNPGGGEVDAQVRATGGAGGSFGNYPYVYFGRGGDAFASVTAHGVGNERLTARSYSMGGAGAGSVPVYGFAAAGGNAVSLARAVGSGPLAADALANTRGAQSTVAASAVSSPHVFSNAGSSADLSPAAPHRDRLAVSSTLIDEYGAYDAPGVLDVGGARTQLLGLPNDAPVDAWLAGNPNAQAASEALSVLALGSLGASRSLGDDLMVATGSFDFELDVADLEAGSELALAFLDNAVLGGGIDLLQLSFHRDGAEVFAYEFSDTATAQADLDDFVIDLGAPVSGDAIMLTLDYTIDLDDDTASFTGFVLDFALLGKPVPEPGAALLVVLGAFALYCSRVATAFAQR